jgi:rhodanese-related sulfurtransferase
MCYYWGDDESYPGDGLLLRMYVRREPVLWHEEIAQLRALCSDLTPTHRQRTNWLVGFLFLTQRRFNRVSVPEIQAEELKRRLDRGENLFLLDVRDEYEFEIANIGGHLIPLPELSKRLNELNNSQEIVALCKMGPRGVKAVELLQERGFSKVSNLRGGIHAWSDRVDRSVRKY